MPLTFQVATRMGRCRAKGLYRPAYAGARNIATGTARFTTTDLLRRLIRSISCMVCAVNQDSPQCGHEIRGMPSITSRSRPLPKLRVTARSVRPVPAQYTQGSSERIDGDENELAAVADFDDGFCGAAVKPDALDNALDFARFAVALARGDAAGEDDVFEVEGERLSSSSSSAA